MKICGVVAEKDIFEGFRLRASDGTTIYAKFKKRRCPLGVFYEFEPPLKLGGKDYKFQTKEKEVYPHVVPLSERTVELLRRYLKVRKCKKGEALFTNDVGERLSPSAVYYIVRQWGLRLLNKPIHPHQLRHSCAIALRKQGIPIELIGDFLGHKNLNTTRRYARILPAELKEKIPQRV